MVQRMRFIQPPAEKINYEVTTKDRKNIRPEITKAQRNALLKKFHRS